MGEFAGYLPGFSNDRVEWQALNFGPASSPVQVSVPVLSETQMIALCERVKLSAADYLISRSVTDIIDIIDCTIARLLNRDDFFRLKAEKLLPVVTGYDPEMIRLALTQYLKTFRKPELTRFLTEDFPNPQILDSFQPLIKGGFGRAFGPNLLAHIWAGNVPGLAVWSLVAGLLVKAGSVGKVSSAEPLFAGWFANALAETEPEIASCFAIVWWKGGDKIQEQSLFARADAVLAYGSTKTLGDIRDSLPVSTRFLGHGHKVSFGIVSAAALTTMKAKATARLAAHDITMFDQQGCYSPQNFYVERGAQVSPREFAGYLAHELACFEEKYPRRVLTPAESRDLAKWRHKEELKTLSDAEIEVLGDAEGAWVVVYYNDSVDLSPSGLNRTIKVVSVDTLMQVPSHVQPYKDVLQTVGIAATPEELHLMAKALGAVGVTRVSGLGHMSSPEAGWHHDGRFNLIDLVTITEIEGSAETASETLAPYLD